MLIYYQNLLMKCHILQFASLVLRLTNNLYAFQYIVALAKHIVEKR